MAAPEQQPADCSNLDTTGIFIRPWIEKLADLCLLLLALVMLGVWLIIACARRGDLSKVDHNSGEWIGLAYYVAEGQFYPSVYRDGYFGGTRHGPVPILLHGTMYSLMGDPIRAGKLLALFGMLALIAGLFAILKRLRCPTGLAALAGSSLLATDVGWHLGLSIRIDAWAAATQLAALLAGLGITSGRRYAPLIAGVLCSLAVFIKVSAFAAALALFVWLLLYHRRQVAPFVAAGLGTAVVLAAVFYWHSQGRYLENFRACLLAGEAPTTFLSLSRLWSSCKWLLLQLRGEAAVIWALVPLGLAAVIAGPRGPERTLLQIAFLAATLITLLVFTNPGTSSNHLVELLALIVVLAASAGGAATPRGPCPQDGSPRVRAAAAANPSLRLVAFAAFFWLALSAFQISSNLGNYLADLRLALAQYRGQASVDPATAPDGWRAVFRPDEVVLATDSTVPVLMGQRPVVLNSFMLKRIVDADPEARADIVNRINRQEFDWVLIAKILPLDSSPMEWGVPVVEAIQANYRVRGQFWFYDLYERKKKVDPD